MARSIGQGQLEAVLRKMQVRVDWRGVMSDASRVIASHFYLLFLSSSHVALVATWRRVVCEVTTIRNRAPATTIVGDQMGPFRNFCCVRASERHSL